MSSEQYRRSMRIVELDSRKAEELRIKRQKKDTCKEDTMPDLEAIQMCSSSKRGRRKAKTKPGRGLVLNTVDNQVQKAISWTSIDREIAVPISSTRTIPDKSKLELLLSRLQRRDSNKFFAEPVDPSEVENYYEVIKKPMDFRTITKKLNEGSYEVLEDFECDVFLISSNAMTFNAANTIYYTQAQAVKELAEKLFDALKSGPEKFVAFLKRGKRTKAEAELLNYNSCSRRDVERVSKALGKDRRNTYKPFGASLSKEYEVVSFYDEPKVLKLNNGSANGYTESLMRFADGLGPTVQKIAMLKIERCSVEASEIRKASLNHMHYAPKNHIPAAFSTQRTIQASQSSNFVGNVSGALPLMQSSGLSGEKTSTVGSIVSHAATIGGTVQYTNRRDAKGDFLEKNTHAVSAELELEGGLRKYADQSYGLLFGSFPFSSSTNGGAPKNEIPPALFSRSENFTGNVADSLHMQCNALVGEQTCAISSTSHFNSIGGTFLSSNKRDNKSDVQGENIQAMSGQLDVEEGLRRYVSQSSGCLVRSSPISSSNNQTSNSHSGYTNIDQNNLLVSNMPQDRVHRDKPIHAADVDLSRTKTTGMSSHARLLSLQGVLDSNVNQTRYLRSINCVDSRHLGREINQVGVTTNYGNPNYKTNQEHQGRPFNWLNPPELKQQHVQAAAGGGGETHGDNLQMGEPISQWFDVPTTSLVMTDMEVPTNRGKTDKQSEDWNLFNPTELGNQEVGAIEREEFNSNISNFQAGRQVHKWF